MSSDAKISRRPVNNHSPLSVYRVSRENSLTDRLNKRKGEIIMLNVQRKNLGTVSLLNLEGRIVVGETGVLQDVIQTLPATNSVMVDLSDVTLVDAHGLGVLLQLREQAQAKGLRFELVNISRRVREVLRLTRLDFVFQINSGAGFFPAHVAARQTPIAA